jgi:hypothetical protein
VLLRQNDGEAEADKDWNHHQVLCDLKTVIWNMWEPKRLVSNSVPLKAGHSTHRGDIQRSRPSIWKESIFGCVEYGTGILSSLLAGVETLVGFR